MLRTMIGWLSLAVCSYTDAQSISGVTKDSVTHLPIRFATVAIRRLDSISEPGQEITNEKGRFLFQALLRGTFEVTLSCIGYDTKKLSIVLAANDLSINLGSVMLNPSAEILKEVVVGGKKSLIEERIDRTVYHADWDKTLIGDDATDVLRRVPLLSVDIDGNVSLRGSQNIQVLINGKPSTMTAYTLADALKQIPADQIKSVEVITSPSAKYDAEGAAGIINIILKKNQLRGILLDADMAIGSRASFLGLDGQYRNKEMGLSIGGFGRATYNVTGQYKTVQAIGQESTYQQADIRKADLSGNYTLGWDYEPDKQDQLTASLRYSLLNGYTVKNKLESDLYFGAVLDSALLNQMKSTGKSGTLDMNVVYTHTFAKPRREFSFLSLFSRNDRYSGIENIEQNPENDLPIGGILNKNLNSNREVTLQSDYQTPIDSGQLLAFGAKYIDRDVESSYQDLTATSNGSYQLQNSPNLTNLFEYHQRVAAGYIEYTLSTKSAYSFQGGARYESTLITSHLREPLANTNSLPNYGVFVPSLNIARRMKNGKMIKLAYTRRIQRPSIQFLNPNWMVSNPFSFTTGNPALGPEYSNNIEVAYNTAFHQISLNFAGFYRLTTQAIESLSLPSSPGDTIEKTYANIGRESTYGVNVFSNLVIGQKISLSGGADLYCTALDNGAIASDTASGHNRGWILNARLSGGYAFKKGWSLYIFSWYRGREILLQGFQSGLPYYSVTLKREFLRKRGTVGFGAENFLSPGITVKTNVQSPGFLQHSMTSTHTVSFRIYMSCSFGKLVVEQDKKEKKSITNDDLKQQ